jgi:polyribonucleotide nucleotidyltransferase
MKLIALIESVKAALNTTESFLEFLHKRLAGAIKIEKMTRKKGGYSLLTAIHYKAKLKPYKDAIKHATKEERDAHYKDMAEKTLKKLSEWDKMSQREFQSVMGELEVYGEVYLRSTKPESIRL